MFIAAYNLGFKVLAHPEPYVQRLKLALATASTLVTLLVTGENSINPRLASAAFPALLICGGLITFFDARRPGKMVHYFTKPSAEQEDENRSILKNIAISPYTGLFLIAVWLVTLVSVVAVRAAEVFPPDGNLDLFESFFRIGSIIYGGGQVVLPMLLTEVVDPGWVTEAQFFQGFALVQSLPGPLFNFSAFLGGIYKGMVGAVLAWIGLFGPGLLLILAFLPFWMRVRRVAWFKTFLSGVNAAAIGLIVAATAQLWEKAVTSWATAACFFFAGSAILFFKAPAPVAILLGGLLGFILSPTALNFAQDFD